MLSQETAHAVYDILVEECGASESQRPEFVHHQVTSRVDEWRFMGALGFGGKFWRNHGRLPGGTWGEVWYVTCYPEDSTPEREAMIRTANWRLTGLNWALNDND